MFDGTQPDVGWAWMTMLGSFGSHIIHGFFLYDIGILNVAFLENFNKDVGKSAWACGIFLGLFSLCGPLSGIISNKWSCRTCMLIGSFLMTSGFVMSAFINDINLLLLTFGVIAGFGAGLCYSASVVVVGFNFERHVNLASGIAVSGCGIGAFSLAPLMQLTKDTYGYSGLCLMCGALSAHHCVFGALFRPSQLEEKRKILQKDHDIQKGERHKFIIWLSRSASVLFNKAFLCLFFSLIFCSNGMYLMYVHFSSLAIHHGTSEIDTSYLLAISGICNGVSRFLVGMASNSDNINELLLYCGCFSLLGLSGIIFPLFVKYYLGQAVFVIMLGMYSGCCYSLLNSITVKLVGIRELASAFGMEMFGAGIGSFIGPPMAGVLIREGGTYSQSFLLAGFTVLAGAIMGWSIACFDKGKVSRREAHCTDETIVVKDKCDTEKSDLEQIHLKEGASEYEKDAKGPLLTCPE